MTNIPDKQAIRIMRGKLFAANVEADELPIPLMQNDKKSDKPAKKSKGNMAIAVDATQKTGVSVPTVKRDAKFVEMLDKLERSAKSKTARHLLPLCMGGEARRASSENGQRRIRYLGRSSAGIES